MSSNTRVSLCSRLFLMVRIKLGLVASVVWDLLRPTGLAGNLGSIYASRISTCLHVGKVEDYNQVEWTLLAMNVPVQIVFLVIIWLLNLGHLDFTIWFFLAYFLVSMLCVSHHFFIVRTSYSELMMFEFADLACAKNGQIHDPGVLEAKLWPRQLCVALLVSCCSYQSRSKGNVVFVIDLFSTLEPQQLMSLALDYLLLPSHGWQRLA